MFPLILYESKSNDFIRNGKILVSNIFIASDFVVISDLNSNVNNLI